MQKFDQFPKIICEDAILSGVKITSEYTYIILKNYMATGTY